MRNHLTKSNGLIVQSCYSPALLKEQFNEIAFYWTHGTFGIDKNFTRLSGKLYKYFTNPILIHRDTGSINQDTNIYRHYGSRTNRVYLETENMERAAQIVKDCAKFGLTVSIRSEIEPPLSLRNNWWNKKIGDKLPYDIGFERVWGGSGIRYVKN